MVMHGCLPDCLNAWRSYSRSFFHSFVFCHRGILLTLTCTPSFPPPKSHPRSQTGEYSFCFSNRMSTVAHKTVCAPRPHACMHVHVRACPRIGSTSRQARPSCTAQLVLTPSAHITHLIVVSLDDFSVHRPLRVASHRVWSVLSGILGHHTQHAGVHLTATLMLVVNMPVHYAGVH